jgi:predicted dehydrogenase
MLNTRPVHFGLIGTGAIARSHAAALATTSGASLAAVADIDPVAARAFGIDNGCAWFGSLAELLAHTQVEALIVCTPPDTHCAIAVEAAASGVHVLCEKPLALDADQAWTMLDAAARAGVLLTMATKFRYVSDIMKARNMIQLGVLGDVLSVTNEFKAPVDMSRRWNATRARSGGGVLIDNGTHSVDIVRYLLGPIARVRASEGARTKGLDVEETVQMSVVSSAGVPATIELSWSEASSSPYYLQVVGTRGRIAIGWKESVYQLRADPMSKPFGAGYDKIAAFSAQLRNIVDVLCGQDTVEVGHADALASVAAVSAAYASLETDRWVAVGDDVSRSRATRETTLAVVS